MGALFAQRLTFFLPKLYPQIRKESLHAGYTLKGGTYPYRQLRGTPPPPGRKQAACALVLSSSKIP